RNMRALYDLLQNLFLLLLFDRCSRLLAPGFWRSKLPCSLPAFSNQNMASMHLLYRFALLILVSPPFEFDDVVSELSFHDVADLAGLQCKCSLFKFRYHLSFAKPTKVATFVFTSID